MQGIIRCGNGKYYCSPIFGMYINKNALNTPFHAFVICFDESKTKLVKQPLYNPIAKPYLELMVLFTDDDQTGWINWDNQYQGVDFLPLKLALKIVNDGLVPCEIQKRCIEYDLFEDYSVFKAIKTEDDIKTFMLITGELHDARIVKLEKQPDGSLYVLFDGVWGCSVELVFSGDVAYCAESRNPEKWDPYWFESSIVFQDGLVYFFDSSKKLTALNDNDCWFKAKTMAYRIIPE